MSAISYPASRPRVDARDRVRRLVARPELFGVIAVAAALNLWSLSVNGWANTYYSAAVRSMTTSWHNFLFASLDPSGLMTVDKPPLSLWVQALSARIFGFHPLSLLVPQALMGVAAAALMYDLVRRRFGRVAGTVAGIALATTPTIVAVSRHNNPDELLVLCSVAAVWFGLRALDTGRTRWLVWSGVAVGLGFETKMGVALMLVPAIAAAWLWMRLDRRAGMRANLRAVGQLLWGGLAMVVVAGAWPLLVTLTPSADRPWISGTSDNSVWSLIFGYNGLGRVAGQTGGPAGGAGGGAGGGPGGVGGSLFGGPTGVFRMLQSGLGDQAGWLLGFALVSGIALVVLTRLRRSDPRSGFVIVLGGTLLTVGVVFSFASGIFHPYYVSMLAPWSAALIGAGVGEMLPRPYGVAQSSRTARIVGPAAIVGGAITELVVLGELNGAMSWARPLIIVVAIGGAVVLALRLAPRVRTLVVTVALAALLAAPATWAAETIGHATNGTFPTGGPASAQVGGPGSAGGPGGAGRFGRGGFPSGAQGGFPGSSATSGSGAGQLPMTGGAPGGFAPPAVSGAAGSGATAGATGAGAGFGPGGATTRGSSPTRPGGGGMFGGDSTTLTAASAYAKAHGGGAIGVSSQSSAAAAILSSNADVAGLGGFSGRESSVTVSWLASEVAHGKLRWLLAEGSQSMRLPGDTRTGSTSAITIAESVGRKVTFTSGGTTVTMYDLRGKAAAILAAAARGASS
jgi:4-amino-4-deoxy-L-arabinose transferase-like glycosyltransferase